MADSGPQWRPARECRKSRRAALAGRCPPWPPSPSRGFPLEPRRSHVHVTPRYVVTIATRRSALALAQCRAFVARLAPLDPRRRAAGAAGRHQRRPDPGPAPRRHRRQGPLRQGDRGGAARRAGGLRRALHQGRPGPARPRGSRIACIPAREDPRDVLVAPAHGTLERAASGRARRHLEPAAAWRRSRRCARISTSCPSAGNVDTRLRKLDDGRVRRNRPGARRASCGSGSTARDDGGPARPTSPSRRSARARSGSSAGPTTRRSARGSRPCTTWRRRPASPRSAAFSSPSAATAGPPSAAFAERTGARSGCAPLCAEIDGSRRAAPSARRRGPRPRRRRTIRPRSGPRAPLNSLGAMRRESFARRTRRDSTNAVSPSPCGLPFFGRWGWKPSARSASGGRPPPAKPFSRAKPSFSEEISDSTFPSIEMKDVAVDGGSLVVRTDEQRNPSRARRANGRSVGAAHQGAQRPLREARSRTLNRASPSSTCATPSFSRPSASARRASPKGACRRGFAVIFFGAETRDALRKIQLLRARMIDTGVLWIVRPKASKAISEADVFDAMRRPGWSTRRSSRSRRPTRRTRR